MSSTGMTIDGGCCCHGRPATSQPSVAVLPGNTAWTGMPLLVSSCCSERLKARTYALDAPYRPRPFIFQFRDTANPGLSYLVHGSYTARNCDWQPAIHNGR